VHKAFFFGYSLVIRSAKIFTSRKIVFFSVTEVLKVACSIVLLSSIWVFCKRKSNHLEHFKIEVSAGAQRN